MNKEKLEELKLLLKNKSKTGWHVRIYESLRTRDKRIKHWIKLSDVINLLEEKVTE